MKREPGESEARFSQKGDSAPGDGTRSVHELSAEALSNFSDAARQAAQQARASAASLASEANEQIQEFLRAQIGAGADLAQEGVEATRAFAERLEDKAPHVADMLREAAGGAERLSRSARDKSPAEILELASGYARRRPAAFIGAAVAVGFFAARFLKSSPSASPRRAPDSGDGANGSDADAPKDQLHDA